MNPAVQEFFLSGDNQQRQTRQDDWRMVERRRPSSRDGLLMMKVSSEL
jgi:hypothetical protein